MAVGQGAVLFRFLLRCDDRGFELGGGGLVFFLGPVADLDQVLLQAGDRVAQRKWLQSSAGRYLDGSSEVECGPAR